MNLESYLHGALKRVSRYLAHFEQSKTESRPFSLETQSLLRCELPSKSSEHSQTRTTGISRHSENRYLKIAPRNVARIRRAVSDPNTARRSYGVTRTDIRRPDERAAAIVSGNGQYSAIK